MFSSWWSKASGGAFSCDLGTEIKLNGLILGAGAFTQLHSGTNKQTSQNVSVFVASEDLSSASGAVKKIKTLKHPSVITFIDAQETEKAVLLATESVEPLMLHLNKDLEHRDQYLAWGVLQVFRGVAFLHEANLVHGSLHAGSIFVTPAGEWKLFGFEQMKSNSSSDPKGHFPRLSNFHPPEYQNSPSTTPAQDIWGLGCIIWQVFNGTLNSPNDLARIGNIPKKLSSTYMELVAANPSKRPNPGDKIKALSASSYFKNDIIDVMLFLEELQIKDDHEKSRFFTGLPAKLEQIPQDICVHKILPECIKAFDYSNAGALILAPVFKIGKYLNTEDYQAKIVPCIVKLFSSSDRNARFKLLSQIEHFVEHLNSKVVNNEVFPQIQNGFIDKEPIIREKTVIAMIHLASKLNQTNLDETVVMKHFSRLLRDEQAGIRTNTAVCLGKIARSLHYTTRQKVLIPAFGGKIKDPFPPARIAAINAIAATQQFYTLAETSGKVVPMLCALMSDPEKPVREQAFKVIKGFIEKLEQVSENPNLKEEMEREVTSTNSQVLNQAASWANWAVGAIGAKFYKSANKPPPPPTSTSPNSSKENTPVPTEKTKPKAKESNNELIDFGAADDNADGDGWNDDDEDWGSLESASLEDKKSNSSIAPSPDFDSWADDFMSNKVPDKSAVVKQSIQPIKTDNWDDWGNESLAKAQTDDEKKKQREEKRIQRQKELEAKRAAKKGPMKLGAKKSSSSAPSNDPFDALL